MKYFLLDTENVGSEGLAGVTDLASEDIVDVFYTKNSYTLKMPTIENMIKASCQFIFSPVSNGTSNALDYQLITKLMLTEDNSKDYFIIAKDKGYDCAIVYAQSFGYTNIRRAESIETALRMHEGKLKITPEALAGKLNIKDVNDTLPREKLNFAIHACISSDSKQKLYQKCVKEYGMQNGLQLYSLIKEQYAWVHTAA